MKPLNHKERRKAFLQFTLAFSLLLLFFFLCCFFSLYTGEKGIKVLEERHAQYTAIFEKQAAFSYDIDNIIKQLYQLKNKDRTLSQHRQFQELISKMLDDIAEDIKKSEQPDNLAVYSEMVDQIKEEQVVLDQYEEDNEEYSYFNELLATCITKYQEEAKKRN